MERYQGVRFETRVVDARPPEAPDGEALVRWCRAFTAEGFSPVGESAVGNLSVRMAPGFLVTPTHLPFLELEIEDLVHLIEVDGDASTVTVRGRHEPTSEAFMHHAIYACRPDVNAVFHGHGDALLAAARRAGLPTTPREVAYGTPELARLAADVAREHDLFLLAHHGFVALGATMDQAGKRARSLLALVVGPPRSDGPGIA